MGFQQNRVSRPAEIRVLNLPQDGSEEYKVSLLLHVAFLLFCTAWFALFGRTEKTPPGFVPIRLVGPLSVTRPGSGNELLPQPGSRLNSGIQTKVSPGLAGPERAFSATRKIKRIMKGVARTKPSLIPVGETEKKGKSQSKKTSDKPSVVQAPESPVTLPKPRVAALKEDEVTPFSTEPSAQSPFDLPMSENDLGEPLPASLPADEPSGPIQSGVSDKKSPPSGKPDAQAPVGGGEMEIGGIETLAGGTERYEPPTVISRVLPDYPEWAREKGINGQAVYKVLIQESGTVADVLTLASTIDPKLAIIGSQSLRRWVFTPVLIGGEPKETWVRITVQFTLK